MKIFKKIGQSIARDLARERRKEVLKAKFKDKVKLKLTKLGVTGEEHPLFCKHEHCLWWQLKHLLIKKEAKQRAIEKLNKIYIKKQEERDEEQN